jgi:hypothetical protein
VVFYLPPFDKRTLAYAKHFIAYVRGATGVQDLKDLDMKNKSGFCSLAEIAGRIYGKKAKESSCKGLSSYFGSFGI